MNIGPSARRDLDGIAASVAPFFVFVCNTADLLSLSLVLLFLCFCIFATSLVFLVLAVPFLADTTGGRSSSASPSQ